MKKLVSLLTCAVLCLGFTGCAEQRDEVDKALDNMGALAEMAVDGVSDAKDGAINALATLDRAMGNEEGTTLKKFGDVADKFKETVKEKVEPVDPEGYMAEILDTQVSIEGIKDQIATALEPTEYANSESYKFLNSFDRNKYDITYTILHKTENANLVQRTRVVKDNSNIYLSDFVFDQASTSDFDVFGIVFNNKIDDKWYSCNQLLKTRKEDEGVPRGYTLLEAFLGKAKPENFNASTLNKLVSTDNMIVESFSDSISDTSFIYQEGKLKGIIYNENNITTIVMMSVNEYNEESAKLTTVGTAYKVAE